MRITSLELTNFRSFQATQRIEFAPVTLLFGPNSVGKSTVLMALFYLQQILEKGHCDPMRLDALGSKHIGGFKNLVNGRDLNKRIVLKVTLDKKGEIGASYNRFAELLDEELGLTVDSPCADADNMAVELHIGYSKKEGAAFVACYRLWLDDKLIAELSSDDGLKQPVISYLNYRHPALLCDTDEAFKAEEGDGWFVSLLQRELNLRRMVQDHAEGSYEVNASAGLSEAFTHVPVGFKGAAGALPPLGQTLQTTLEFDERLMDVRAHEILSDVLVAPLDNLLALLKDSLCIGPLRLVPDALYQTDPYPEQKDWYSGAAAWDVLGRSSSQILAINRWMGKGKRLDLGYAIRIKISLTKTRYQGGGDSTVEILSAIEQAKQFGGKIRATVSDEELVENPAAEQRPLDIDVVEQLLLKELALLPEAVSALLKNEHAEKIVLWDEINNIEVSSTDIGVGVSQLLPLIVAAVDKRKGIIACEQPELHVHPRIQVGIGDLLTQNADNKTFLVETHSEHLILRILKRIRQTSDDELPEGVEPVYPQDVAIVYMEPTPDGTKTWRIEIDGDGEFRQRWPNGFFAERREELM
ncbi:AAA family ATPase [Aeromonas bestiarum]|uniref:AAA family ATPase n=1 Tax=Aeromonas bestiarum TaxID=105751 RepID=UPI0032B2D032